MTMGGELKRGAETAVQFDREIGWEAVAHRAAAIAEQLAGNTTVACYVFGMGSQSASCYADLDGMPGVKVLWHTSILPKKWRWLRSLIASEAGLLRINEVDVLVDVFMRMIESSMAAIYVVPVDLEGDFVTAVRSNPTPVDLGYGMTVRDNYFIYMVDADNRESSTGVFEIVSYGTKAPVRLA